MNNTQKQYAIFKEKQLELEEMLKTSSQVLSELNMEQFQKNLRALSEKVHNDTFKILVVGSFKTGKSTLINSFLGEKVFPTYAPTAIINEVKYGKEKRAVLYFRDPLPDKMPESIPEKVQRHIQNYKGRKIPPIEIPYTEIENYIMIPMDEEHTQMLFESPYEKLGLFWPLPLLESGVEIIDFPGLSAVPIIMQVTRDHLTKADAILLVLRADALCSQDEMYFINFDLKGQGFTEPFFIVNRFDLISEYERDDIRRFAKVKLEGFSNNEIFFVSSQMALDGKAKGDNQKFLDSGMDEFEKVLSDFLTKQKGRAKLAQPARELKRILNEEALFKVIPAQREILGSSLKDIKRRYEEVKPVLSGLEIKRQKLRATLDLHIARAKPAIKRTVKAKLINIADSVPAWVEEFEPSTSLGVIPTKAKCESAAEEIAEYVNDTMKTDQLEWREEVLLPLIEEKAEGIFDKVEKNLDEIYQDIDGVTVAITGNEEYSGKRVHVWSRVAGVMDGPGLTFSGGLSGSRKELVKTLAVEIGAELDLCLLELTDPVASIMEMLTAAYIIAPKKRGMSRLKEVASSVMVKQFSEAADKTPDEITDKIIEKYSKLSDEIVNAVDIEIKEAQNQIDNIISEMEKRQADIDARKEVIDGCAAKIQGLNKNLDSFISDWRKVRIK